MATLGIVKMDIKGLDEVRKKLDGKAHDTVCMRALNKTVKNVQAEGKRAIREQYNIKTKDIVLDIWKAAKNSLRAVISASTRPLNLIKFGARQVAKGVSIRIRKGSKKIIKHAFIAQPKGRDWKKYGQTQQVTAVNPMVFLKAADKTNRKKKLFAKKRKSSSSNYPIDRLVAPSLGAMLKNETVHDRMQTAANERMEFNLYHELDYFINSRRT